jgi:hypothetical protein
MNIVVKPLGYKKFVKVNVARKVRRINVKYIP